MSSASKWMAASMLAGLCALAAGNYTIALACATLAAGIFIGVCLAADEAP